MTRSWRSPFGATEDRSEIKAMMEGNYVSVPFKPDDLTRRAQRGLR